MHPYWQPEPGPCEADLELHYSPRRCWLREVAPLFIDCQQHNIQFTREGVPGHGPQAVVDFQMEPLAVIMACGCALPLDWLPRWERAAALALFNRLRQCVK